MPDQKDIYRSAHILIKQHGEEAEAYALSRMRKYMGEEDVIGASAWLVLAQAIQELRQDTPSGTIH